MTDFKKGDCVTLKHGGENIQMTVDNVRDFGRTIKIICTWYEKETKNFKFENFSPESLIFCIDSN